jgi:hypothetical protein
MDFEMPTWAGGAARELKSKNKNLFADGIMLSK